MGRKPVVIDIDAELRGTPELDHIAEVAESIDGWLWRPEGELLYWLAAEHDPSLGEIVELGSYHGRSTTWLVYGSRAGPGVPVHCCDLWPKDHEQQFIEHTERVGIAGDVVRHRGWFSALAHNWHKPIGLLFIDGDHSERGCWETWRHWRKHLANGAIVVRHDAVYKPYPGKLRNADVGKWYFRGLARHRGFEHIGVAGSCAYGILTRDPTNDGSEAHGRD